MAQKPNYISERQRYIPSVFEVYPSSDLEDCADKDTKLGDLLSRYSVLFKCEDIKATPADDLKFTRRGQKFYDECAAVFGSRFINHEIENFRVLIIPNYRGRRAGYNYEENTDILVFDKNGFLAANPQGRYTSRHIRNSFCMIIDDVLYIAFIHERYSADGQTERDYTCNEDYTKSDEFDVVGIVTDKNNFAPASSIRLFATKPGYTSDCEVGIRKTLSIPSKMGIDVADPPPAAGPARINRWLSSPAEDLGLFISVSLKKYADNLQAEIDDCSTIAALKRIPGISGLDNCSTEAEIRDILDEIKRIIISRSDFIFFSAIDESKYTITKTDSECWFEFASTYVTDLDLYLIKDYKPFTAISDNVVVSYRPNVLMPGSRFFAQNREKSFSCHLVVGQDGNEFTLDSIGDDGIFADSLKQLKLFEKDHGLYAIPLISYNRVDIHDTTKPLYERGVPCLKVKEPDVMLWIDGVKMVPYVDYRIEGTVNDVCSCQYIKLTKLPGSSAASTDPDNDNEDPRDDAMFPLPNNGREYEITVIVAWPRGNFPTQREGSAEEAFGLLDRYIGPTINMAEGYMQYPIEAAARQNYFGNGTADDILLKCTEDGSDKCNVGFNYSDFLMIPIGAVTELSVLMFQNGRYIPTKAYKERVAGDRIPVFNSGYGTFQDLELHFLFDLRIREIREILKDFKTEEGNFDFILRRLGDKTGASLSNYISNLKTFVTGITNMNWLLVSNKATAADEKFYGFNRWINTATDLQNGAFNTYLEHHGYNSNADIDVYLDGTRSLDNDGFRSINADASVPNQRIIGEVHDVPTDNLDPENN